jgi:hypothetical protein
MHMSGVRLRGLQGKVLQHASSVRCSVICTRHLWLRLSSSLRHSSQRPACGALPVNTGHKHYFMGVIGHPNILAYGTTRVLERQDKMQPEICLGMSEVYGNIC